MSDIAYQNKDNFISRTLLTYNNYITRYKNIQ